MNNEQELKILVSMRDEFSNKLSGIDNQLKTSVKEASKAQVSFKKLATSIGGMATVYASLRFAMSAITESAQEEEMFVRLATLTKNSTNATNESIYALREQANALEKIGVVSADNILTLQGQLATYDLNTDSIRELTPALLDMAVAERGVNVTQQDMISFAEGVSKAIQGNYASLQKRGFILSDDTKKIIENGTEQERITEIVKVLNSTYQDTNKILAQTSSGSMQQFQNKLKTIKQQIGSALMPTLGLMQDGFIDMISISDDATDSFEVFGDTIFRLAKLFSTGITSIKNTATGFIGAGDVIFTYLFGEEKDLEKALKIALDKAGDYGAKIIANNEKIVNDLGKVWGESGFDRSGFDISKLKGNGGGASFEDLTGLSEDEIEKSFKDLTQSYDDFVENIDDNLYDLKVSHKKASDDFKASIDKIKSSMNDLNASFASEQGSDRSKLAGEIVANEERVAEIQTELAGEVEKNKRRELEAELQTRLASEQANKDIITQFASEIAEAKRVAGLTDLERAIEEFNSRRAIAQQEYNEKMATLKAELKEVRQAQRDEKELYIEKTNIIREQEQLASDKHTEAMKSNLLTTKETIEKEIEYYKRLATAMDAVRGSNTAQTLTRNVGKISKVNDAIINPNGDIITTHPDDYLIATKNPQSLSGGSVTININTMVGSREFAEEMGNDIIRTLQLNQAM